MDLSSLKKMLNVFGSVSKGEMEIPHERMSEFLEKQAVGFEINGKSENIVF
jgi:hypothetical protein